jgi:mannose-6-phosphate isomerase-like protein (cupin superfamily)
MASQSEKQSGGPIIGRSGIGQSGGSAIAAVGSSLVVYEWTDSGPSYMHIHQSDDEAWHVLEGALRFKFADGEVDAPVGTTVFVPAGTAHTYWGTEPSRYLIILNAAIGSPHRQASAPVRPVAIARHAGGIRHGDRGRNCGSSGANPDVKDIP